MESHIFRTVHHVCIVVHDIEATVAYYESIGVGPWQPYPPFEGFTTLDMPDVAGFYASIYRVCMLANLQLQLCQPGPGTPQADFVAQRGEGVFHIGFEVADCDAAEQEAAQLGIEPWMRGRKGELSGFTYFRTPQAGVTLEVRKSPPG
jgi:catechol 2,3-dioxygenase-like lactoylglutathione lyase family enzyme